MSELDSSSKPVFVIEPCRGMFTMLVEEPYVDPVYEQYKGDCSSDIYLIHELYVHGTLEDMVGFDIADLARGHISYVETQPVILVSRESVEIDAVLVIRRFGQRVCGLIVLPDKIDEAEEYWAYASSARISGNSAKK